jgi:hypothetical protein
MISTSHDYDLYHMTLHAFVSPPPSLQETKQVKGMEMLEVSIFSMSPPDGNRTFSQRQVNGVEMLPWGKNFVNVTLKCIKLILLHRQEQLFLMMMIVFTFVGAPASSRVFRRLRSILQGWEYSVAAI